MKPPLNARSVDRLGELVAEDNAVLGLLIDTRYEVVRRIARGGMGEVFLAQDRRLHRPVAMKILAQHIRDPRESVRFQSEARTLAEIEHPGIVPVHDLGVLPDGRRYYTMKYVAGRTLRELLNTERSKLLAHLAEACEIVHHAHERGLIHRDLKPENVMVDEKDRVYVVDWGLARMVEGWDASGGGVGSATNGTQVGSLVGTLPYMAPEQARGEVERLDRRTDVFALGAILYEILTAVPPVGGKTWEEALRSAREGAPLPPRQRDPQVPAELEAICLRALAPEPSARYPTARALANDLHRFLDREPVTTFSRNVGYRAWKKLAKHRRPAAIILGSMLCLGIAIVFLVRTKKQLSQTQNQLVAHMRETTEGYLSAALALRRAGRIAEMREFARKTEQTCQDVVREIPTLAEPHYRMGRMYRALMDFDSALAQQEEALRKDPLYLPAKLERGLLRARKYRDRMALLRARWMRIESERIDGERGATETPPPPPEVLEDDEAKEWREKALADLGGHPDLIARATACELQGDEASARAFLEQAATQGGSLEEAYEGIIRSAVSRGDWKDAMEWCTRGHESDRGYWPFLQHRAVLHLETGKRAADPGPSFQSALADAEQLLALDPTQGLSWMIRGHALRRWGMFEGTSGRDPSEKYRAAVTAYESAPLTGTAAREAGIFLARVKLLWADFKGNRDGDSAELLRSVLADLEGVASEDPDSLELRLCRARARTLLAEHLLSSSDGDSVDALLRGAFEDLRMAVRRKAQGSDAWEFQGDARTVRARLAILREENPVSYFEEAIAEYGEALLRDADSHHALQGRANARSYWGAYLLGRREDPTLQFRPALQDLDQAAVRTPASWSDEVNRGSILLNLGLWEGMQRRDPVPILKESVEALDRAAKRNPSRAFVWVVRANAKALLYRGLCVYHPEEAEAARRVFGEVEKDFAEALRLKPADAEALRYRGMFRHDAGYVRTALEDYEKAIERVPRLRAGLSARIEACRKRIEKSEEARREGDRLFAEASWRDALECYERAVGLDRSLEKELGPRMDECRKRP